MTFATDIDLLSWESNLMRDASAVAQTLLSGAGNLAGAVFTINSGSLHDAHISSDHVITLGDPIAGSFPVTVVGSATELTLSVMYDDLYPDSGPAGEAIAPGAGNGLSYWIRTFWPQRRIVSELLLQAAGVSAADAPRITNRAALRRPCALGSLQMIYSALAAAAAEPANLLVRAELYERLYRRALRAVTVELDLNCDGVADARRMLNVVNLQRS